MWSLNANSFAKAVKYDSGLSLRVCRADLGGDRGGELPTSGCPSLSFAHPWLLNFQCKRKEKISQGWAVGT